MAADDYALIESGLRRIELPVRLQLHLARRKIKTVYFLDGIVSIVAVTLDGGQSEVGLFGREGTSETATIMGTDHSPHEAYVQVVGISALTLPTKVLKEAMASSSTLRLHLLKYAQAMVIQLSRGRHDRHSGDRRISRLGRLFAHDLAGPLVGKSAPDLLTVVGGNVFVGRATAATRPGAARGEYDH